MPIRPLNRGLGNRRPLAPLEVGFLLSQEGAHAFGVVFGIAKFISFLQFLPGQGRGVQKAVEELLRRPVGQRRARSDAPGSGFNFVLEVFVGDDPVDEAAPFGFGGGNYTSAFYMATGFHGFHVLVGTIFLIVCLVRTYKGHFTPRQHFGFEAAAWYWHFVDVVWLFLFIVVYIWGGWGAAVH